MPPSWHSMWHLRHQFSLSTAPKPPRLTLGCTADQAVPGRSDLLHSDSSLGTEREMVMFGNILFQAHASAGCWKSYPEPSLFFMLCSLMLLPLSPQLPGTSPAVKQSPPADTCDKPQHGSNPAVNRDRQKLCWTGTNL